ncbi:uncharacterized protein N7511_009263 [Penicillium nucicola]|uniref:uncharacterized protein n=1 Tax=Penicillium nucicola TaxID=1850975 RepID=UPI00254587D7|nr:uncharacterized protein N7511_009263 [Penicillium nucicola]KAJ5747567.1 hypothetical protein N7511_009263 [Penicillium nucicola]
MGTEAVTAVSCVVKTATGSAWRTAAQILLPMVAACAVETAHAESRGATRALRLCEAPLPVDSAPRRDNWTRMMTSVGICLVEVCVARLGGGQGRELGRRGRGWRCWERRGWVLGAGRLFDVAGGNRGHQHTLELASLLLGLLGVMHLLLQLAVAAFLPLDEFPVGRWSGGVDEDLSRKGSRAREWLGRAWGWGLRPGVFV